uniref:Uncharacterized protein n=1 Tax=Panagrolaimus superbus TaxID=310955 RepID=A0A914ZC27_9BILA
MLLSFFGYSGGGTSNISGNEKTCTILDKKKFTVAAATNIRQAFETEVGDYSSLIREITRHVYVCGYSHFYLAARCLKFLSGLCKNGVADKSLDEFLELVYVIQLLLSAFIKVGSIPPETLNFAINTANTVLPDDDKIECVPVPQIRALPFPVIQNGGIAQRLLSFVEYGDVVLFFTNRIGAENHFNLNLFYRLLRGDDEIMEDIGDWFLINAANENMLQALDNLKTSMHPTTNVTHLERPGFRRHMHMDTPEMPQRH